MNDDSMHRFIQQSDYFRELYDSALDELLPLVELIHLQPGRYCSADVPDFIPV